MRLVRALRFLDANSEILSRRLLVASVAFLRQILSVRLLVVSVALLGADSQILRRRLLVVP